MFSEELKKEILFQMADTLTECFGSSITQYLSAVEGVPAPAHSCTLTVQQMIPRLRELFLHHLLQLRCNSHTVSVVEVEVGGGRAGPVSGAEKMQKADEGEEEEEEEEGMLERTVELKLGSALYPTASQFNHSCWPNVFFRFIGNTVAVVAIKPIEKGEELCNCYGPQVGRMKRSQRQAELKNKYFFECTCPACSRLDKGLVYQERVLDAYSCIECEGILERTKQKWICCDCSKEVETCDMEEAFKLLKESERHFRAAMTANLEASLPLLLECHRLQSRVLHKHNMQLARTSDAIAHTYALQGDFQRAVDFCEASCRAVEAVHGSHAIELATEVHKLTQLLFNSHQFSAAAKVAKKVLPLMQLYHSPNHPDILELRSMIHELK